MATIKEKCGKCDFRVEGICRRSPPHPFPFPTMNPITGEQSIKVVSLSPPVGEDDTACGEFKHRLELVS